MKLQHVFVIKYSSAFIMLLNTFENVMGNQCFMFYLCNTEGVFRVINQFENEEGSDPLGWCIIRPVFLDFKIRFYLQ
jgi:hypothetical protein